VKDKRNALTSLGKELAERDGALAAQEAGLSQRESECVFVVGLYKL
jgi:hypothetical protein